MVLFYRVKMYVQSHKCYQISLLLPKCDHAVIMNCAGSLICRCNECCCTELTVPCSNLEFQDSCNIKALYKGQLLISVAPLSAYDIQVWLYTRTCLPPVLVGDEVGVGRDNSDSSMSGLILNKAVPFCCNWKWCLCSPL